MTRRLPTALSIARMTATILAIIEPANNPSPAATITAPRISVIQPQVGVVEIHDVAFGAGDEDFVTRKPDDPQMMSNTPEMIITLAAKTIQPTHAVCRGGARSTFPVSVVCNLSVLPRSGNPVDRWGQVDDSRWETVLAHPFGVSPSRYLMPAGYRSGPESASSGNGANAVRSRTWIRRSRRSPTRPPPIPASRHSPSQSVYAGQTRHPSEGSPAAQDIGC